MTHELPDEPAGAAGAEAGRSPAPPPLAWGVITAFAAIKLGLHFVTVAVTPYGIHRDEFLYLAMGQYLRFWRMDFPPEIGVLAKASRALFGDTLFAVRFFPAVAGAILIVLTGMLAREFGGGRRAQVLSMLAVLVGPLFLRAAALFQPVVFDQLWWTLGLFAVVKIAAGGGRHWWVWLGLTGGLGLLTKFSIGFFAAGVGLGLLLSDQRRWLATPWPYVAGAVALAAGSASLVGQIRLGFPVVVHLSVLRNDQLLRLSPLDFLSGQLEMFGPALVLGLIGFVYLMRAGAMRRYRVVGWTCAGAFLMLMALRGKAYYIGPIYPALFGAGAAALAKSSTRLCRTTYGLLAGLVVLYGLMALPFGLPVLPPGDMARYATALGQKGAVTTNRGEVLALPQDYADMLGWEERVKAVARVYHDLPPDKQARAVLLAANYGEAGALEFYGPRYGLTGGVILRNSGVLFSPGAKPGEVAVALGLSPEFLSRFFRSVELVTRYDHPFTVTEERNVPIVVAEGPNRSIREMWPPAFGR